MGRFRGLGWGVGAGLGRSEWGERRGEEGMGMGGVGWFVYDRGVWEERVGVGGLRIKDGIERNDPIDATAETKFFSQESSLVEVPDRSGSGKRRC